MKRNKDTADFWYASDVGEMLPTQANARAINQNCTQAFHGIYRNDEQARIIRKFLSDDYNGWY